MTSTVPRLADPAAALAAARALAPRLAERAAEHDRAGAFPEADFADVRDAGLLGLMAPQRLGGPGAGFADYAEVAMALAAGNGATALIYNMHASVTGALARPPDDVARALGVPETYFTARDEVLRGAVAGSLYAVAMSERGAGSRLSALTTSYERTPDGFHLKGSKTFVSGAGSADAYLVAARSGDAVSHFFVPAGPGVTVEETWDSLGMRATGSQDLHLDVTVPEDALLGGIEGLTLLLAQVMPQWLVASYAAVYVGVAQAAVDAAVTHITERKLRHLPAVRARIGRADARVAATRLAVLEAAHRIDAAPGDPETNRWVWRAKLVAGETAMEVAASMLEAAGTSASRRGHPLERLFRDARCGSLQPATSDVCADWLGVAALGGDPEGDAAVPQVVAAIVGAGHAFPETVRQDAIWDGFFRQHFAGSRLAKRIFSSAGVTARHCAANPLVDDVSSWSTEARMRRYVEESVPLGKDAVSAALDAAGVTASEVGMFVVASCTGYTTPGLDILLARDLGMAADVQRLFVGHMGCYAAIPALGAASDFVVARGRPAVLLCLELTSLHLQPPVRDVQQLVVHALFGDAASAVVLRPGDVPGGLTVVDVAAQTDVTTADHMTWDVTDLGFRMGLSPRVPDVLAEHVRGMVTGLLARHGLEIGDVAGWAVHPGGPRILDVVAEQLELPDDALHASRAVLAEHGNCSSATVLLVLDALGPLPSGGHVVALAFGPGLTLYATLLRVT